MTLVELSTYFRNGGSYEDFCHAQLLEIKTEAVGIFMAEPFDLANKLSFFELEMTDEIGVTSNGVQYFNLFDFFYFLDAIEESKSGEHQSLTDDKIASILFSYAINDA